jgi:hypothetical protein
MPRRRTRKTNWRPQEERRLRARIIRRGPPDEKKLARAFIGLALARAEADAQSQAEQETAEPPKPAATYGDGSGESVEDDHAGA